MLIGVQIGGQSWGWGTNRGPVMLMGIKKIVMPGVQKMRPVIYSGIFIAQLNLISPEDISENSHHCKNLKFENFGEYQESLILVGVSIYY